MNKRLFIVFTALFMFLLISPLISSWMSPSHLFINEQTLERAPNSPVGQIVSKHFDDYSCGNYMTDASVFFYFSEGFTSLGKEYKATHSPTFAQRCVAIAQRNNNERQLAFCWGIASHLVQDSTAHNDFVPRVIRKTKLVNGIVHVLAEEKVDDQLRTDERLARVRSQLRNVCGDHREFFVEVAEGSSELKNIDVGRLYDAFIDQVAGSDKYSVGFQNFLAIPMSIHVMLMLTFFLSLLITAFLIRRKNRNIFNWITIGILIFIVLVVLLTYILFFTGTLWKFFMWASYPLSAPLPTSGWEGDIQKSVDMTVDFWNSGALYLNTIPDPSGSQALGNASREGSVLRTILTILLLIFGSLFVWLNFRKRKKRN